jgi:hypothetical protein
MMARQHNSAFVIKLQEQSIAFVRALTIAGANGGAPSNVEATNRSCHLLASPSLPRAPDRRRKHEEPSEVRRLGN